MKKTVTDIIVLIIILAVAPMLIYGNPWPLVIVVCTPMVLVFIVLIISIFYNKSNSNVVYKIDEERGKALYTYDNTDYEHNYEVDPEDFN